MTDIAMTAPLDLTVIRRWIVAGIVVTLQSGMAMFLYHAELSPLAPITIVVLAVGAFGLLFLAGQVALPSPSLLWWAAGYLVLTVVGFYRSTGSAVALEELGLRLAGLVFLVCLAGLTGGRSAQTAARWALVATTLLGVALNCVDAIRPLTFSQNFGRSAGFHRNPNIAAVSLGLGLLLALPVVPRRWRAPFVVTGICGVALTISRGGLLILALGLLIAAVRRVVSPVKVLHSTLVLGGVAVGVLWYTGVGAKLLEAVSVITSGANGWERLFADRGDASLVARTSLAREAWGLLADHPLLGAGLGATIEWRLEESTHNIYLRLGAEYGILGLMVMPWLVAVIAKRRAMPFQLTVPALVVAFAVSGLFSHNVLNEWPSLVSLAIAAGAPYTDPGPVE